MNTLIKDRPLGRMLAGVSLLSIGLICLAFVVINLVEDIPIWVLGRPVTAEVVDSWAERTSDNIEGELTFQYFIRYRFAAPNGQVITKDLKRRGRRVVRPGGRQFGCCRLLSTIPSPQSAR